MRRLDKWRRRHGRNKRHKYKTSLGNLLKHGKRHERDEENKTMWGIN